MTNESPNHVNAPAKTFADVAESTGLSDLVSSLVQEALTQKPLILPLYIEAYKLRKRDTRYGKSNLVYK